MIAKVCRSWVGELAISIIEIHNASSVEALILLLIYELSDPDRGIWDLLNFVTRISLELGYHRIEGISKGIVSDVDLLVDSQELRDSKKLQLMDSLY